MAREVCAVCGGRLPILSSANIDGGRICDGCTWKSGPLVQFSTKTKEQIAEIIEIRKTLSQNFKATDEVKYTLYKSRFLAINCNTQEWCCPSVYRGNQVYDILKFNELINYEIIEDGESVTKGGFGGAVAGAALFGGVGAIVGAELGKKNKDMCNSISLHISTKHKYISTFSVDILDTPVARGSSAYKEFKRCAEQAGQLLNVILSSQDKKLATTSSVADEILKFKQLADAGIITPEEFEFKKKQLLGL